MIKFVRILVVLIILVSIALISAMQWLQTEQAHKLIEQKINKALVPHDLKITLGDISLGLPNRLNVGAITLADKEGEAIKLQDLQIDFVPHALFWRRLDFWSIKLAKLQLLHIPKAKPLPSPTEPPNKFKTLMQEIFLRPEINIRGLKIGELQFTDERQQQFGLQIEAKIYYKMNIKHLDVATKIALIKSDNQLVRNSAIEIDGHADLEQDIYRLKIFELNSDLTKISGQLQANRQSNYIDGSITYNTAILKILLSEYLSVQPLASQAMGKIDIKGKFSNPQIAANGNIVIDMPADSPIQFPKLYYQSLFYFNSNEAHGSIAYRQGTLAAGGDIAYQDNQLSLTNWQLRGKNIQAEAQIKYNVSDKLVAGEINLNSPDLQELATFIPSVSGGQLHANAKFTPIAGKQHLQSALLLENFTSQHGDIRKVTAKIDSQDLLNAELAPASIDIDTVNFKNLIINKFNIDCKGAKQKLDLQSTLEMLIPMQADLNTKAQIRLQPHLSLNITELTGKLNKQTINLPQPIKLSVENGVKLDIPHLSVEKGHLKANLRYDQHHSFAKVLVNQVPLRSAFYELPNIFKKSILDGQINLSSSQTMPKFNSHLDISNIELSGSNDVRIKLNADGDASHAKLLLKVQDKGKHDLAKFDLNIPHQFQFPGKYALDKSAAINGALEINTNDNILALLPLGLEHSLAGQAKGKLQIHGNLTKPTLQGQIKLIDGAYQHHTFGVNIAEVGAILIANGQELGIKKLKVTDATKKIAVGNGNFNIANKNFALQLKLDNFSPVTNEYFEGKLSGNLKLAGNAEQAQLDGKLTLGPAELKIPQKFDTKIEQINVTKEIVNYQKVKRESLPEQNYQLKFDVDLATTDLVYIRGWGVDSLLKGSLKIQGSSAKPLIYGRLNSVRGHYREFGKNLKISKGIITFDGPLPPSPYINVVGQEIVQGTEINLMLVGPIDDLDVQIQANPELPQEQALSLLLFGSNVENISTWQAIQLANGVRKMSGGGGGFDPMEASRKALGIDNINIKNDQENPNNTTVGVGKYLTDKIYVEIEQGSQNNGAKTNIEIQLTPKISLENSFEQDGNSSVGINWRFDY